MMAQVKSGSYGHHITYLGWCIYRLSWKYDTKLKGSRLRFARACHRDSDFNGAVRFARKWGLAEPQRKEPNP